MPHFWSTLSQGVIAVGARGARQGKGAVFLYKSSGLAQWTLVATLEPNVDAIPNGNFGWDVVSVNYIEDVVDVVVEFFVAELDEIDEGVDGIGHDAGAGAFWALKDGLHDVVWEVVDFGGVIGGGGEARVGWWGIVLVGIEVADAVKVVGANGG